MHGESRGRGGAGGEEEGRVEVANVRGGGREGGTEGRTGRWKVAKTKRRLRGTAMRAGHCARLAGQERTQMRKWGGGEVITIRVPRAPMSGRAAGVGGGARRGGARGYLRSRRWNGAWPNGDSNMQKKISTTDGHQRSRAPLACARAQIARRFGRFCCALLLPCAALLTQVALHGSCRAPYCHLQIFVVSYRPIRCCTLPPPPQPPAPSPPPKMPYTSPCPPLHHIRHHPSPSIKDSLSLPLTSPIPVLPFSFYPTPDLSRPLTLSQQP